MTKGFCSECNKTIWLVGVEKIKGVEAYRGRCSKCGLIVDTKSCAVCGALKMKFGGSLPYRELKEQIRKEIIAENKKPFLEKLFG